MALHPDLVTALDHVLARQQGQSEEFRKRFRRLVDNVVSVGRVKDADVREVLDLVVVPDEVGL